MKAIISILFCVLLVGLSGCFRTTLVVIKGGADYLYPICKGKGTVIEKTTYMEDGKYADVKTVITITDDNVTVEETLISKQGDVPPDEDGDDKKENEVLPDENKMYFRESESKNDAG